MIPASAASIIASAAKAGGTKIIEVDQSLKEDRKYNQEELLRLDLIAHRKFNCDYEKCTDEQKAEVLKDKVKVGVKEALQESKKDLDEVSRVIKKLKSKEKAISIAWQKAQDKAANEKDPKKKAKAEAVAKKIEDNMKAAKDAIQTLSNKLSGGVGESNESFDTDFWTINALLSIIESQIEDFNNDIEILND